MEMLDACFGIPLGSRKVWLQGTAVHRKNLKLPKGCQVVMVGLVSCHGYISTVPCCGNYSSL